MKSVLQMYCWNLVGNVGIGIYLGMVDTTSPEPMLKQAKPTVVLVAAIFPPILLNAEHRTAESICDPSR